MSRFLFVVPPLTGHINPTISVGHLLQERGHDVAWAGHASKLRTLLAPDDRLIPLEERIDQATLQELTDQSNQLRGLAAMKFLWEDILVPLGRAMRPGVEQAVDDFAPDVLVADQQALAGALVARQRGLNWATFVTSAAGLIEMPLPKVWDWVLEQLAALQREAGLAVVVRRPDNSPHRLVVFTTPDLAGDADYPEHCRFVGPSIGARDEDVAFPWDALRPGRRVLASLGTVNPARGERFYGQLTAALAGEDLQVILAAPRELLGSVPENFIVQDYVPQLRLLPEVQVVLCHAGQNTVSETLAHGLPLVVTPIKDDQGLIASQVVDAGAGLRVRFGRIRAAEIREAVLRVLEEPSFGEAARRIQASFAQAGGAARAADLLEELL